MILPTPETMELFRARALTLGVPNPIPSDLFPRGEGWTRLQLMFHFALVNTTGTGARSEGELNIIRAIQFKTSKNEYICAAAPGRHLYYSNAFKYNVLPVKDAIAVTTATTYDVPIDIMFSDPLLAPEEKDATILDTSRYTSLDMVITLGTLADLFTSAGDAAVTATLDATVERYVGALPAHMRPGAYVQYGVRSPVVPTTAQTIELEKSADLAYKRLMIYGTTGAGATAMDGALSDAVIADLDIEKVGGFVQQNTLADSIQRAQQVEYKMAALTTGVYLKSFVDKSRSLSSVLTSIEHESKLRVNWRNGGSLPGTPQVTLGYEAFRRFAV